MGCLTGCIQKYQCQSNDLKRALDADAIGPWVTLSIDGTNKSITVGNQSAPSFQNRAVITSFQYGQTDGSGMRCEIVDEEGGTFTAFFNKILTDLKGATDKYQIRAEWGWVGSRCGGGDGGILANTSRPHYFLLTMVDVKFEETMKFVLEGTDIMQATSDSSRQDKVYGSENDPLPLKAAIRQMFQESNPPIKEVKYYRRNSDGSIGKNWEFKDDPKGKWVSDQQNPLAVARKWIRGYTSDRDKGIYVAWDDSSSSPTVVFWEDAQPKCGETKSCGKNIGTYIVNGGNCSPVISFNPRIKWPLAAVQNVGGFANSKVNAKNLKQQDEDECEMDDEQNGLSGGITTENITPDHHIRTYGDSSPEKFRLHDKRNGRASSPMTHTGITADMVIQGDPTLDDPIQLRLAYASIVVINPYHLDEQNCPEWMPSSEGLAGSTCNEVMSNSNWIVQGVSHEIRLGSYTTTLKLWLAPPGGTINRSQNLGASNNGYNVPKD